MSIEDRIRQAIESDLPAQVGDALKERLQQAGEDAAEVLQLRADLDVAKQKAADREAELQSRIEVLKSLKLDSEQIERDRNELLARERAVERGELRNELEQLRATLAEKRADDVFKLSEIVFRNPLQFRRIHKSDEELIFPQKDQHGYDQYPQAHQTNKTTTIEDGEN